MGDWRGVGDLVKVNYSDVRHLIQQGDDLFFSGEEFISNGIKVATKSQVSHIGSIFQTFDDLNGTKRVMVIESTQLDGAIGVQTQFLSDILKKYKGKIWWAPLSQEIRAAFEEHEDDFFKFMHNQQGKGYDYVGAFASWLDITPFENISGFEKANLSTLFCSELRTAALCEIFKNESNSFLKKHDLYKINPSEITPSDCARQRIHTIKYYQLLGESTKIKEYNKGF